MDPGKAGKLRAQTRLVALNERFKHQEAKWLGCLEVREDILFWGVSPQKIWDLEFVCMPRQKSKHRFVWSVDLWSYPYGSKVKVYLRT